MTSTRATAEELLEKVAPVKFGNLYKLLVDDNSHPSFAVFHFDFLSSPFDRFLSIPPLQPQHTLYQTLPVLLEPFSNIHPTSFIFIFLSRDSLIVSTSFTHLLLLLANLPLFFLAGLPTCVLFSLPHFDCNTFFNEQSTQTIIEQVLLLEEFLLRILSREEPERYDYEKISYDYDRCPPTESIQQIPRSSTT